jgi:hypothetical protein
LTNIWFAGKTTHPIIKKVFYLKRERKGIYEKVAFRIFGCHGTFIHNNSGTGRRQFGSDCGKWMSKRT